MSCVRTRQCNHCINMQIKCKSNIYSCNRNAVVCKDHFASQTCKVHIRLFQTSDVLQLCTSSLHVFQLAPFPPSQASPQLLSRVVNIHRAVPGVGTMTSCKLIIILLLSMCASNLIPWYLRALSLLYPESPDRPLPLLPLPVESQGCGKMRWDEEKLSEGCGNICGY